MSFSRSSILDDNNNRDTTDGTTNNTPTIHDDLNQEDRIAGYKQYKDVQKHIMVLEIDVDGGRILHRAERYRVGPLRGQAWHKDHFLFERGTIRILGGTSIEGLNPGTLNQVLRAEEIENGKNNETDSIQKTSPDSPSVHPACMLFFFGLLRVLTTLSMYNVHWRLFMPTAHVNPVDQHGF